MNALIRRNLGSVRFTTVVNTKDANEVRWFEVDKDPPLADAQSQFTGTVFEGFHIAVAGRGETYQGCIDPCLDDAIEARDRVQRRGGKRHGGSQPKPASHFFQGDIFARFRPGRIQLVRGLGIDDFLLTLFGKKGNGYRYLSVRKASTSD